MPSCKEAWREELHSHPGRTVQRRGARLSAARAPRLRRAVTAGGRPRANATWVDVKGQSGLNVRDGGEHTLEGLLAIHAGQPPELVRVRTELERVLNGVVIAKREGLLPEGPELLRQRDGPLARRVWRGTPGRRLPPALWRNGWHTRKEGLRGRRGTRSGSSESYRQEVPENRSSEGAEAQGGSGPREGKFTASRRPEHT